MKINKKISKYNHQSRGGKKPAYIVIHYVGAVSTAKNNATYFAGGNRNASAHFFVDDSSVWQSVDVSKAAWHCGGGLQGSGGHSYYGKCTNLNSIGIEMCCKKVSGKLVVSEKTEANTAWLVKKLMADYGIKAANVIRHWDVTGKNCPGYWTGDSNARWKGFKNSISSKAPKKPYFQPGTYTVIASPSLNIRSAPDSTKANVVGSYKKGAKVKVLSTSINSNGNTWGKTNRGYIAMRFGGSNYVK